MTGSFPHDMAREPRATAGSGAVYGSAGGRHKSLLCQDLPDFRGNYDDFGRPPLLPGADRRDGAGWRLGGLESACHPRRRLGAALAEQQVPLRDVMRVVAERVEQELEHGEL